MKKRAIFLILLLTGLFVQAAEVWEPKTGTGPETSQWRRLVVYGDQWGRKGIAGHGGVHNLWRNGYNPYIGETKPGEYFHLAEDFYDADGDGDTTDGYTASLLFSETERLGMSSWPTVGIYPTPINWDFYGGVTWDISDAPYTGRDFSLEMGINAEHNGHFPESAEDHPFQAQQYSGNPNSRIKTYWTVVWKKEDFLNGGSEGAVSIGPDSRMVVFWDRYWIGVDVVRFVIKNDGQYYVHDKMFTFKDGKPTAHRFELNPNDAKWAKYNPKGHDIRVETNQAFTIDAKTFTNIEAAGFHVAKDKPRPGMLHIKWYNFEFDGTLTKKARPSEHIDMVDVPGTGGVQDFYMSSCEVPFKLWHDIYKYGESPNWATEARSLFNKDGDMGSMQFGPNTHDNREPVVNFTVYDAVVWCNSLSEKEGLSPVFYADENFTEVFRYTNIATRANESYKTRHFQNPTYITVPDQPVYVKWDAEGYRPPTPAEWEQAYNAGKQTDAGSHAWVSANSKGQTQPVGTKNANGLGLYDMVGNVWELTWTFGDVYTPPGSGNSGMALGGGFSYPTDPRLAENSASPYGDHPFNGHHDIGLRLVRRNAGLAKPALGTLPEEADAYVAKGIQKWKFSEGYKTMAAQPPSEKILKMVSIPAATKEKPFYRKERSKWHEVWVHEFELSQTEISYAQWLKVYFWGIENGYGFDADGCMGSMRWWDFAHSPDEPVAAIGWHDMLVWCNALSAMEGLDPVYYTDEARTQEYKKAMKFRGIKKDLEDQIEGVDGYAHDWPRDPWLFANWAHNGYRLPAHAEWAYAARGGLDEKAFQWGDDGTQYPDYSWDMNTAGGTTHPVGQLKPNGYGLYDMQGNVYEAMWGIKRGNNPDRAYNEDLNNPKESRYGGWKKPRNIPAPRAFPHCAGGSFFWAATRTLGDGDDAQWMAQNHNASDIGFRVAKSATGTHPVDGLEELVLKVFMEYDTSTFDPLQGRCSQGNLFRDGQYPEKGVASGAKVKWTADLGGPVKSSPVTVDGVVYVGGPDGFYALDAQTGKQRWKISIPEGVESSACVVDGVVYFGANDKKMYAIHTDGTKKWVALSHQGKNSDRYSKPIYSPVAVAYDTVFAVVGYGPRGFSTKDGKLTFDPGFKVHTPKVAVSMNQDYLFWGHESGKGVQRGHLRTGKQGYGHTGVGSYCRSSAVVRGDMFYQAYAGGSFEGGDSDYASYKSTYIKDMTYKYRLYSEADLDLPQRTGCFSSPAIWKDRLLLGLDSGRLESYALDDGSPQANFFKADGAIRSPITVSTVDNMAYFGSWDDNIYGIDAKTLKKKWAVKTGGNVDTAVCVSDGKLYAGSDDGKVYCIEGPSE